MIRKWIARMIVRLKQAIRQAEIDIAHESAGHQRYPDGSWCKSDYDKNLTNVNK